MIYFIYVKLYNYKCISLWSWCNKIIFQSQLPCKYSSYDRD